MRYKQFLPLKTILYDFDNSTAILHHSRNVFGIKDRPMATHEARPDYGVRLP